ncbi:EAL domain-containing protein [Alteromonas sp. ASW11-19]|uniref:EAL domain-containing protein n=1 Tax=Alteromonas salexigens TaxID=2982530 RepID=A0ABT2VQ02_9ALTE|nr:EAL domain-containing protein [Alteromonas salexigens]MCU7555395.1 EAL domain-containing protein [Alteromonas salexigens]
MLRFLVIDDDELTAKTLQGMAQACGADAKYVCDHTMFFEIMEQFDPDIIALDLRMPHIDGIEVLREMARRRVGARVFIISGAGTPILSSAKRIAHNLGINLACILSKPFSIEQLQDRLNELHSNKLVKSCESSKREMNSSLNEDEFLTALKEAIKGQDIEVYFQPKVRCDSGTLEGFEVLARWRHPTEGFINPELFISLCEIHGLIDLLTMQVFEKALAWLSSLDENHITDSEIPCELRWTKLSINISAQSLSNDILFSNIIDKCKSLDISPSRITLEITESSAMDDSGPVLENLTRLRLMGFELSIDDFGTGYSSLLQLVKAPFSEIKIDKTFVLKADADTQSRAITKSITDLGRSLETQVTAEGVESAATMDFLKHIKCHLAQGYFIGRPMPQADILNWFYERERSREKERLDALRALELLDTPPESRFDRITRLTRRLFDVPIALISLLDEDRQWFKSAEGLTIKETPRGIAFCDTAIRQDGIFIVEDARQDKRFRDNPLVTGEPNIRFYAGKPLQDLQGHKFGTLCIIDAEPRMLSYSEIKMLGELAEFANSQLTLQQDDVLDEKIGILPRGTYNAQARKIVQICRQLSLNLCAVSVRIMNFGTMERELGEADSENLLRDLNKLLLPFGQFTDLLGRRRYAEVVAMVIAPGKGEELEICDQIHKAVVAWCKEKSKNGIYVDCEIGISTIPPGEDEPYDTLMDNNWQLYAAIIIE